MVLRVKAWQVPLRLGAGAFIINSGVSKLGADDATAAGTHGFAASAYPPLGKLDSRTFVRVLTASELTLGAALLLPVVPSGLVGVGLVGFSAGLVGLYLRTPGLRQEGSLRPTEQGLVIAKDIWLLAIGASFIIDRYTDKRRRWR